MNKKYKKNLQYYYDNFISIITYDISQFSLDCLYMYFYIFITYLF